VLGNVSLCCDVVLWFIVSGAQLNMRAVFLHVLGDALGSVVVIISGVLIKFINADWKYKIDPALRYYAQTAICIITVKSFRYWEKLPSVPDLGETDRVNTPTRDGLWSRLLPVIARYFPAVCTPRRARQQLMTSR